MNIPDLRPNLRFEPLPRDDGALRYAFEAKRAAMGPYIVERWGWDEALQMRLHAERFRDKPFVRILRNGVAIGTLSLMAAEDYIRFGEFYLFPDFHRQGIGGRVLRHCLALADAQALPVRLEYLKWNPVGSLYRRHGFVVIGETDIHWLMERQPT